MIREAVMICFDNCKWIRDEADHDSRIQAQHDALFYICHHTYKRSNSNVIGVVIMGGEKRRIHIHPTSAYSRFRKSMPEMRYEGELDLVDSILIAQAGLNKWIDQNYESKVIVIVASPIKVDMEKFQRVADILRSTKTKLHIVDFEVEGCPENSEILENIVSAVNNDITGSILHVSFGPEMRQFLLNSPLITGISGESSTQNDDTVGEDESQQKKPKLT